MACLQGYDGGLSQTFNMVVQQSKTDKIVMNATGQWSSNFTVHSLEPGTAYELFIWSANTKGRSGSVVLLAETNVGQAVERRAGLVGPTTQAVVFHMTPILGALIGIGATLIIVAVVIVFIVRTRERDRDPNGSASKLTAARSKSLTQLSAEPGPSSGAGSGAGQQDKRPETSAAADNPIQDDQEHNPDVVPNKHGTAALFIEVDPADPLH